MQFQFNDGGRKAAGFKGYTGDCVVRAIAIATGIEYRTLYNRLSREMGKGESPRNGVPKSVYNRFLSDLGWCWTPTMKIGQGCTVHLNADELPKGVVIVRLSRHIATVIDGVLHDNHDCTRDENRCVYGYWVKT